MRRLLQLLRTAGQIGVLALISAAVRRPAPGAAPGQQAPPDDDDEDAPSPWRRRLLVLVGLAAAAGLGGFLVAASGLVPIKASSGHWAVTAWFLNFSMARSVSTHSLGLHAPPLEDRALVLKGAGHYETGCTPCHGSPELRNPRIARAMTPHPPYLPPKIREWDPEELFYIVKHGVKFTGMPAWPAQQRDDEVWAVVAFLLELPGLEPAEYRALVHGQTVTSGEGAPLQELTGPEKAPRAILESCGRCHGIDGLGRGTGAFPRLAGQRIDYLDAALQAYAHGKRHSGIMEPIAAGLPAVELRKLALYYAGLPAGQPTPRSPGTADALERGAQIARHGIPAARVPACADCHGPDAPRPNPAYPVLAGQYADYLVLQLELFKKKHRGGSAYAHLMHPVAAGLEPRQMRDVALYYESLSPAAAARFGP